MDVPLKEYIERLLQEHNEVHKQEAIVRKSTEESLFYRLGTMNEIRDQLTAQEKAFATKYEVDSLKEKAVTHITRGELFGWLGLIMAIGTLIVAVSRIGI